ncbi:phospholipid carrier-dependent glycosyltransferase [Actinomyces sp. 2119]|uniref:Polyprenol-phosphate-mannose--protein mannosyltransferase n=1 Tax=Actinomyces lilanjuaniae TaxID=2321394 RepID=A0ABM6Z5N4_9ACTO|nr:MULTISPECIES: phospholipid carrier-dependent glycosyltransferase [Actinomyces]AYD90441.1 phospholipid carrier-dependent glycosyltransferase [Actinomyces lilanjuaniae]RJF40293.1 phospholipid carrier-dependent glycosyltransferase [Actinomyces sp. 2119]
MTTASTSSPDKAADAQAGTAGADLQDTASPAQPNRAEDGQRAEDDLRAALGLDPAGSQAPRAVRVRGWVATGAAGIIATLLRLLGLAHPSTLMFDETYYVKDAYALWTVGYEAQWAEGSDELFAAGDFSGMSTEPSFVVHPQLGKWLIGLGMQALGPESPVGWRIVPAIAGVLTVVLLARLTFRLTGSPVLTGLAGLLLAIDGVALTESRIGLLDVFVGLFATLTMYCLVRDRQWSRARLARDLAGTGAGHLAPRAHVRPWLWATGAALGLTCSIKWSGLYLLAVVGVMVVVWDTQALKKVQAKAWFLEGTLSRGIGDFIRLVPTTALVYLLMWWSWFTHDGAYKHGWAAQQRAAVGESARSWLPDALNDLVEYHLSMYTFHVGLDSEHPYQSRPAGWLLQLRPTSFYWAGEEELAGQDCGSQQCVQAITSIGNIPVWWAACVALVAVVLLATVGRDWRAWVPLAGYLGLYVPWFQYPDRTIFTFYTVAFVPFVVLVLVLGLGMASGLLPPLPGTPPGDEGGWVLSVRRMRRWLGGRVRRSPGAYRVDADDVLAEDRTGPGDVVSPSSDAAVTGAELTGAESSSDTTSCEGRRGLAAVCSSSEEMSVSRQRPLPVVQRWTGVPAERVRRGGVVLVGVVTVAAVAFAVGWWCVWTGTTVSYEVWRWHMLLGSWI